MAFRKGVADPRFKQLREGFWRMIQRIHLGIPGLRGTGDVSIGQFTGGVAGVRTAWILKPHPTPAMIDALPVAGTYAFGSYWPQIIKAAGLAGNFDVILRKLNDEFGLASEKDLERGTVPNPWKRETLGETRASELVAGHQFEKVVDGVRFRVNFRRHFVDRYTHDEDERPAVGRFMTPDMIWEEIEKALPQVKEVLEEDPYAQGIIISKTYGLSMKFFPVPLPDGWKLDFATQIITLPLWRTSDREVEIAINPVVPVYFEDPLPEELQLLLLGDLAPYFMDIAPGEEEELAGEFARALVLHGEEGFEVKDAEVDFKGQASGGGSVGRTYRR